MMNITQLVEQLSSFPIEISNREKSLHQIIEYLGLNKEAQLTHTHKLLTVIRERL